MTSTPQEFRGFHYDVARGNYDSLTSLRGLVRFMADCGLNELVLYMEDLWHYRRHPQLSNPHAYAMKDLEKLAQFSAKLGIDLIPSVTTISHCGHILEKPKYKHLAFTGRNADLDVLNPAVYDLFDDIFDEILPHFDSSYVFINGDEMNLAHLNETARQQARIKGLGSLFGQGLGRLARMIVERGRRPIVWHDMLLHHPDSLPYIPKETIIAYWFYDPQPDYPALRFFCQHGFDVLAAPGLFGVDYRFLHYARQLPAIHGQARAASKTIQAGISESRSGALAVSHNEMNQNKEGIDQGRCLGTMTTLWEKNRWQEGVLGIYATGRWTQDSDLPVEQVLRDFSKDVFGRQSPAFGKEIVEASYKNYRATICSNAGKSEPSVRVRRELGHEINRTNHWLDHQADKMEAHPALKNHSIHESLTRQLRKAACYGLDQLQKPVAEPQLISTRLVKPGGNMNAVINAKTKFGHDVMVITNGLVAVAILPDFGAALIEMVLLEEKPWNVLASGYETWAAAEPRTPGDPGLGSPWGASGIGGWRETIFYAARLNPSSIWGRLFTVTTLEGKKGEIAVECCGHNEVAHVRRVIRLHQGKRTIDIDISATNRLDAAEMALQPNVGHVFPFASSPGLRLIDGVGRGRKVRSLLDHDGTLLFVPKGEQVRIESPETGRYLQLQFKTREIDRFLTDVGAEWFSLEPFGVVRLCKKGESVQLSLTYELG